MSTENHPMVDIVKENAAKYKLSEESVARVFNKISTIMDKVAGENPQEDVKEENIKLVAQALRTEMNWVSEEIDTIFIFAINYIIDQRTKHSILNSGLLEQILAGDDDSDGNEDKEESDIEVSVYRFDQPFGPPSA